MCGIAGVYHRNGEAVSTRLLKGMTDALAYRGPDGEGHFTDGPVGLGHRRLAIIDLSPTGHQPMGNETGDVLVVYNGEIYNYQPLRAELQGLGHRFHSKSDTEVIVHAYEEWGEACLDRFNGHFAFAVWDARNKRLFLARDRYGVKPLYYFENEKVFLFASEIKALLTHPAVQRGVDLRALREYFTFQNVFSDRTLFEGVRLLPPGTCLTLDAAGGAAPAARRRTWWDYDLTREPLAISYEDATAEVRRLFTAAVTRQLMSDVPLACFLSGGMDSGSITAVATRHLGRLMTFTAGFDLSSASGLELGFDERTNAEALSNLLKTEHYQVVLHAGDMEQVMPELIWHLEDLRVGQCYPNYYVARLAGKFVKVALSGGGGDELFAGYPWRYYRGLGSGGAEDFHRNYYDFWQRLVPDDEQAQLFREDVFREARDHAPFDVFRSVLEPARLPLRTNEDFVRASLYFELKTFLHGILVVEDRVSMAHSLEVRAPFLDNDLVDFALRLPVSYKLRNLDRFAQLVDENDPGRRLRYEQKTGDGKMVLRDAMASLIPKAVTERVKQGFSAPDASWFRGESIDYINRLLRDRHARIYEFLQPAYVHRRLDEHVSGRHNHRLFIWSLLSFEWWLRRFIAQ